MTDKSITEQVTEEILGSPTPVGANPTQHLQEQRDILEAGIRLALSALAQGEPDTARSHLEEALQRVAGLKSRPVSDLGTLP